ncbi:MULTISPECIES: hypothetical protein [Bacillus amyloliquefaciens group]|uniref:hypothetical protein n=1 Tax=Bacillus amyloliquefaciens group TaxID=1938374 RepID=UPI00073C67C6|nr:MULTISPECIES: hypothetical protein [Bacillus amyloliquefaciens group]KTF59811.1 hypothetical protein AR691_13840 [Bacillus amyloliquefaciens]
MKEDKQELLETVKAELEGMKYWEIQKFLVAIMFYKKGLNDPGFVLDLSNERFFGLVRDIKNASL